MTKRGLTIAEMKAQGERCPCRGADEWCVCQNVPDAITVKEWGLHAPPPDASKAIAAWNRRASPSLDTDAAELVKRLLRGANQIDGYMAGGAGLLHMEQIEGPMRDAAALITSLVAERDELARAIDAAEARGRAEQREQIAEALEYDASMTPCEEDAMVTRGNAMLVRADFSYDEKERLEAIRNQDQTNGQ